MKQEAKKKRKLETWLQSAERKVSKVDEFEHKLKKAYKEIADIVANLEAQLIRVTELGQNNKEACDKVQLVEKEEESL